MKKFSDQELELKIEVLKSTVRSWAKKNDIWFQCGFKTWQEHYNDEPPKEPCVLLFYFENELCHTPELEDGLMDLLADSVFTFERDDYTTITFWVDEDKELSEAYKDYFEWRWILNLLQPDYWCLYQEIFERFAKSPDELYRLSPRQFEIFIDSVFKNNGYRTDLGPGQSDGGVDLRLYTNDIVGESVTLVQAKRYNKKNPIKLDAVQALSAAVEDERANRGLFVTTSRYLPVSKKFASRQNQRLILAGPDDLSNWSKFAAKRITRDKSKWISSEHVNKLLAGDLAGASGNEGKIFYATTGYGITDHDFAIVLKENRTSALLMSLPKSLTAGDMQVGQHIPVVNPSSISHHSAQYIFRAKRRVDEKGRVDFWGNRNLYFKWDTTPLYFNRMD